MNQDSETPTSKLPAHGTLRASLRGTGERLDVVVSRGAKVSRTSAADLIRGGYVLVDGHKPAKSSRPAEGAKITVEMPHQAEQEEPVQDLPVIFEDQDLVVINKPVGVAAHPSPGWTGPTVTGQLARQQIKIATSGSQERAGVVQRLDVGTSGLMVIAKSEQAYSGLKQAFKDRTPTKIYQALVQGLPDPVEGTIDAPIGRHPNATWRFAVVTEGREAVTHYELEEAMGSASLMRVKLETGRTHQIRVHFSALGHPLVGDQQYGADPTLAARVGLTRQWLHAAELGFTHPVTGEQVYLTAPQPQDLVDALELIQRP